MTALPDCLSWIWCWLCWRAVCSPIPLKWTFPLLPFAGLYAYSTTWADFRETVAWNRAGQPGDWEWEHRGFPK
jgi:hypothetical protein